METTISNQSQKFLFSSSKDFLLLGGGSLISLLLIRLLLPNNTHNIALSFELTLLLANFINHPHFAISYLIFYSDYSKKISANYEKSLRTRYFLIGIIFPIGLLAIIIYFIINDNSTTLGLMANAMFFLVGWHYVKQGYGMLMLEAVLKKSFFSQTEKNIFLRNAYATWLLAWLLINYISNQKNPTYFGIPYQSLQIPTWALIASIIFSTFTTVQCFFIFHSIKNQKRTLPWNGIIAYLTSLYAWLLIRDPIIILWIPLFHSLQYLAVTWKFQLNKYKSNASKSVKYQYKFSLHIVLALCLGYLFFIEIPIWLDQYIQYNKEIFGSSLFLFVFWIFINTHHYLIDTVMWRKGNPDVQKYLFQ